MFKLLHVGQSWGFPREIEDSCFETKGEKCSKKPNIQIDGVIKCVKGC